jgi:hypothetical protein
MQVTERIDAHVMTPLKSLIRRQHAAFKTALSEGSVTPTDLERMQADKQEAEEHLVELSHMYARLRKISQQQAVLEVILTKRLVATFYEGVTDEKLDVAKDCIAFLDGVFCFLCVYVSCLVCVLSQRKANASTPFNVNFAMNFTTTQGGKAADRRRSSRQAPDDDGRLPLRDPPGRDRIACIACICIRRRRRHWRRRRPQRQQRYLEPAAREAES